MAHGASASGEPFPPPPLPPPLPPPATTAAAAAAAAAPPAPSQPPPLFDRAAAALWSSGRLCVLCGAALFSLSILFVKLLGRERVPVLEITLVRSALSFAATLAVARARGIGAARVFGRRESRWLLAGRGAFGSASMALYYASVMLLPMADATTLFFTNPTLTAVAASLVLRERLGARGAAGCALSLAGLVILTHPPFLGGGHADWGPRRLLGAACGAGAAVFCAGAFVCVRCIGKAEPALVVAMSFHTATLALSSLPLALGWPQRAVPPSAAAAALLLAVATTSFAGQLLLTRGLQLEPAASAAAVNFSQVPLSFLLGAAAFGDPVTAAGAGGAALIALGIWLTTAAAPAAAPPLSAAAAGEAAKAGGGGGCSGADGGDGGSDSGGASAFVLTPEDLRRCTEAKTAAAAREAAGGGVGSFAALQAIWRRASGRGASAGGSGGNGGGGGSGNGAAAEQEERRSLLGAPPSLPPPLPAAVDGGGGGIEMGSGGGGLSWSQERAVV